MWKLTHDRLPLKVQINKWRNINTLCKDCKSQDEDALHVIRNCSYARKIWEKVVSLSKWIVDFDGSIIDWIKRNL